MADAVAQYQRAQVSLVQRVSNEIVSRAPGSSTQAIVQAEDQTSTIAIKGKGHHDQKKMVQPGKFLAPSINVEEKIEHSQAGSIGSFKQVCETIIFHLLSWQYTVLFFL